MTARFFRQSAAAFLLGGAFLVISGLCPVQAAEVPPAATGTHALIPNDTFWQKQWYMRQIQAPEAWAVSTGTRDVIVAVIDGGVDISHQDLRGNIWTNPGEIAGDGIDNDQDGFVDDVHGWNFVTNSPDVRPVYAETQSEEAWSHGTLVASLIGANGNNGIGIAGMAWNVRIMPLVVLDADGTGASEDVVQAIRYATNHGAKVINLSLAGYDYDDRMEEIIQKAAAAGVVIVAATGNDDVAKAGMDLDEIPVYPACIKGDTDLVIGVGGTDTLDQKSPYANYGSRCTDIVAPAQELFAARPSYPHDRAPTSSVPGYLDGVTGTSLAAPLVSGVAALLRGVHPDWSPVQVRARLMQTADNIESGLADGQKGKMGAGRLNAGRALAPDAPWLKPLAIATVKTPVKKTAAPLPPRPLSGKRNK